MVAIILTSILGLLSVNCLHALDQPLFQSQPLYFQSHENEVPCLNSEDCPPTSCDPKKCKLPVCFCSGTAIPGGLQRLKVPQMISLTFQNGIRQEDMPYYKKLFYGRKNPNGCPVSGTFFVSHEYTDYFNVQSLASWRQEVGVNGILFRDAAWWKAASEQDWFDDMDGEKKILGLLANVSQGLIFGARAPYLQMGGDNQTRALARAGIIYDASRISINSSRSPNLLWPYTYDYDSTQDCVVQPCPKLPVKGLWQVPLLALKQKDGQYCITLDACNLNTSFQVFQLLHSTFRDHYDSNRAPLVLTLSARWIRNETHLNGTLAFLNYLHGLTDVYIVSLKQMIQWIKNPTPVDSLKSFEPWQCRNPAPYVCKENDARSCKYDEKRHRVNATSLDTTGVTYITRTCAKCPKCYPWVGDPEGVNC